MESREEMIKRISDAEKNIKELRESYDKVNREKVNLYNQYIDKLQPVIDFIKSGHYYFSHPDFTDMSSRGPILGKDKHNNVLYVYDLDDHWVKEINMYNTQADPKTDLLQRYFAEHDFEVAMKGLTCLINFPEEIIKEYNELIDKDNETLRKYNV